MRMRSANPVYKYGDFTGESSYAATYGGVTIKTGFLLAIIAIVALYTGAQLESMFTNISQLLIYLIGAPILAIIFVIVAHKNPSLGFIFAPLYAICEGVFLGVITAFYAFAYGGAIVQTALTATFGVLGVMLFLYSTGLVRVGPFFKRLMMSVLFGLIGASLLLMVVSLMQGGFTDGLYSLYILIVVVSVVASALFLLIDFDNITRIVEAGAGKEYEWSLALGLTVTIVWLYIELLRLFAIIARRK